MERPEATAPTGSEDPMQDLLREYARSRDLALRDEIILENMALVEQIANRFQYSGEPLEDLIQEGYIGLINAVDLFDVRRGVKFATYASHAVTGAIQHYLRDKGKLIREPGWLYDLNQRIDKARSHLAQRLGRDPTPGEIAEELDLEEAEVEEALRTRNVFKVSSLEHPLAEEGEDGEPAADLAKLQAQKPSAGLLPVEDRLALQAAIGQLSEVEKKIIHGFFFQDLTKTEIAESLGYSVSHISHLLRQALRQLKQTLLAEERAEMQKQLRSLDRQREHYVQRAAEETIKDDLTGLYNRRYLLNRLEEEIARSERYHYPVSVCLLWVDNLETYEQAYGHYDVQRVLNLIARILRDNSRRIDRLGRYADDQFILLLPHTGKQATVLCERIRERVAQKQFRRRAEPASRLTITAGIAVYPDHGKKGEELLAAAQRALEQGHRQGGNCTLLAAPS